MSSTDWKTDLYDGIVTEGGKPARIASGFITKPNYNHQLPEHMIPTLEVFSNNSRFHGLKDKKKQKFSVHRAMSFLPQE